MIDVYNQARALPAWRTMPDAQARLVLECIRKAYAAGGEAAPFRLRREDMSYRIKSHVFTKAKKALLFAGIVQKCRDGHTGKFMRDYLTFQPPALKQFVIPAAPVENPAPVHPNCRCSTDLGPLFEATDAAIERAAVDAAQEAKAAKPKRKKAPAKKRAPRARKAAQ